MRPEKPSLKLQTTTLWYYPSQQHGDEAMGDPHYTGRTPTYVIWNLLERYTREGDQVIDPFCGGGTTLDVAEDMQRKSRGFDLQPQHERVEEGDARSLPLKAGSVDFVFMDPPYSTHLEYSDDPRCIGKLSAFEDGYFDAMGAVFVEAERILAPGGILAVYVSDSFEKRRAPGETFVGIGAELYCMLRSRLQPVDHICVVRGNTKLEEPSYHEAAQAGNFFLRGFNHLLIFRRP